MFPGNIFIILYNSFSDHYLTSMSGVIPVQGPSSSGSSPATSYNPTLRTGFHLQEMCWPTPSNHSSLSSEWEALQGQVIMLFFSAVSPASIILPGTEQFNKSQSNKCHTHTCTPENFPMPQLRVRESFLSVTILASSIIALITWYFNCRLFPLLDFLEGPGFNLVTIKPKVFLSQYLKIFADYPY